jgi:hypothetical protein
MSRGRGIAAAVILAAALLITWIRGVGHDSGSAAAPAQPTTSTAATTDAPTSSAPTSSAPTTTRAPATTRARTTPPLATRAPARQPATGPRWNDPADIAIRWTTVTCNYTWRTRYADHAAAQAAYVTPGFRSQLAADGAAAWQANVVTRRQVSTCAPVTAVPMTEAPRTATETHVRVVVDQTTARDGARAAPARTDYPLRLVRVAGRWLVDGYSVGG